MTLLQTVVHQLYDFSRLVGLRDRLRCPECKAVGTYKPHGGWLDFEDKRKERRWVCKWCGSYSGPERLLLHVRPNLIEHCWTDSIQHGAVAPPIIYHADSYNRAHKTGVLYARPYWKPWPWEG